MPDADLPRIPLQVPLFFLFCQLVIAVILLQLCALFGKCGHGAADGARSHSGETLD